MMSMVTGTGTVPAAAGDVGHVIETTSTHTEGAGGKPLAPGKLVTCLATCVIETIRTIGRIDQNLPRIVDEVVVVVR